MELKEMGRKWKHYLGGNTVIHKANRDWFPKKQFQWGGGRSDHPRPNRDLSDSTLQSDLIKGIKPTRYKPT